MPAISRFLNWRFGADIFFVLFSVYLKLFILWRMSHIKSIGCHYSFGCRLILVTIQDIFRIVDCFPGSGRLGAFKVLFKILHNYINYSKWWINETIPIAIRREQADLDGLSGSRTHVSLSTSSRLFQNCCSCSTCFPNCSRTLSSPPWTQQFQISFISTIILSFFLHYHD